MEPEYDTDHAKQRVDAATDMYAEDNNPKNKTVYDIQVSAHAA